MVLVRAAPPVAVVFIAGSLGSVELEGRQLFIGRCAARLGEAYDEFCTAQNVVDSPPKFKKSTTFLEHGNGIG